MRQIKYWGTYIGMVFGLTFLSTLLMTVLSLFHGGVTEWNAVGIGMYCAPYLFFAGLFCLSFALISCFQVYAPAILAMGCTRKRFLTEILAVALAEALVLVGIIALLGQLGAKTQMISTTALAGMLGVVLIVMATFLLFSVMVLALGRKGLLIMMILYAIIGGVFGAIGAMIGKDLNAMSMTDLLNSADHAWKHLLPAGCGLFCICSAIVWLAFRRYEVRS